MALVVASHAAPTVAVMAGAPCLNVALAGRLLGDWGVRSLMLDDRDNDGTDDWHPTPEQLGRLTPLLSAHT